MADFRPYDDMKPEWLQLRQFLFAVVQLLIEVRDKHRNVVIKERLEDMDAAINRTMERLETLIGSFDETRGAETIRRGDPHGLTGAELRFKLNNVFHFWQKFAASSTPEHLRKLKNAILTLLKSLLEALNADIAIRETIEGISDIIDD